MMEKYKNKNGFTLIELIVVIAIVGALSVTMGISAVQTMKETRDRSYRETYADIFDAARLYYGLKVPPASCEDSSPDNTLCASRTEIPLCCLIEAGLLDYDLTEQYDPLTSTENFAYDKKIYVTIDSSLNNRKVISAINDSCASGSTEYVISTENIKDYDSWEGDC